MNIELIGERLKKLRQEKGLTLEELQKKTKVHINILKAIEGEALTNLSPIYLKGFIKIYCKALGLDPKEYIPDYKESSASVILNAQKVKEPFLRGMGMKIGSFRLGRNLRWIITVLLVVFISLFLISKISGCIRSRRDAALSMQVKAADQAQAKKPEVSHHAAGTNIPKEASGGIRLVVSAKERCLVFVKVDGRVVFHRVLEKGRSNNWKAKERIDLSLGNASAVEIIVNGQRFKDLGRRGRPLKNIVITEKEGLSIPR